MACGPTTAVRNVGSTESQERPIPPVQGPNGSATAPHENFGSGARGTGAGPEQVAWHSLHGGDSGPSDDEELREWVRGRTGAYLYREEPHDEEVGRGRHRPPDEPAQRAFTGEVNPNGQERKRDGVGGVEYRGSEGREAVRPECATGHTEWMDRSSRRRDGRGNFEPLPPERMYGSQQSDRRSAPQERDDEHPDGGPPVP